jgi:hypothetical protein
MTDRTVWVYVDIDGRPHPTGRLWSRVRRGRKAASFKYESFKYDGHGSPVPAASPSDPPWT